MDEKEKLFLDLNGVLVRFWKERGRPPKEVKADLLEKMLEWYRKKADAVPDGHLDDILARFWEEHGAPAEEVRIALLERMLGWYRKMGNVVPNKQQ